LDSFETFPPLDYKGGDIGDFGGFNVFAFNVYSSDGADFGTFAAGCTATGFGPRFVLVHYDVGVFASEFEVKSVDPFEFIADSNASGAENATVRVDY